MSSISSTPRTSATGWLTSLSIPPSVVLAFAVIVVAATCLFVFHRLRARARERAEPPAQG